MQKVLVFSDLHLVPEGETIIGIDPLARFTHGLAHGLDRHPEAARIVLCGDLAHSAAPAEYARLRHILDTCPVPVSLMLGNHDRRAPFAAAFPEAARTEDGHVQHHVDIGGFRLVFLDTLDEDAPDLNSGFLCDARLDWLEKALASAGDRRVILFTHHPPMITGFGGMDRIGLRNRAMLIERLTARGNVAQIVSGHIHRSIQGAAGGIPVSILKSSCHQMPMTLGDQHPHLSIDEGGAYGLLLLGEEGVIVHGEDFTLPATQAILYP